MDASTNFSLSFAQALESKAHMSERLLTENCNFAGCPAIYRQGQIMEAATIELLRPSSLVVLPARSSKRPKTSSSQKQPQEKTACPRPARCPGRLTGLFTNVFNDLAEP
jgi:hypothetical protein